MVRTSASPDGHATKPQLVTRSTAHLHSCNLVTLALVKLTSHLTSGVSNFRDSSSQSKSISPEFSRTAQNFYPTYPTQAMASASTQAAHEDTALIAPVSSVATSALLPSKFDDVDGGVWGEAAKIMPRKSITVKDIEKDTNVRVNIKLDGLDNSEIPDSFRQKHSVYPRNYFPLAMQSPPHNSCDDGSVFDDESGDNVIETNAPTEAGVRMIVPVRLQDGWEAELPLPRMSKSRRTKERALNELGARMCWDYVQSFNGRPIFIQRSRELS